MTEATDIEIIRAFFEDAEDHVRENDRIWGEGNWVLCLRDGCFNRTSPTSGVKKATFHHREFHR